MLRQNKNALLLAKLKTHYALDSSEQFYIQAELRHLIQEEKCYLEHFNEEAMTYLASLPEDLLIAVLENYKQPARNNVFAIMEVILGCNHAELLAAALKAYKFNEEELNHLVILANTIKEDGFKVSEKCTAIIQNKLKEFAKNYVEAWKPQVSIKDDNEIEVMGMPLKPSKPKWYAFIGKNSTKKSVVNDASINGAKNSRI